MMEKLERNKADEAFQKSESLSMILNKNLGFMLKYGMSVVFIIAMLVLLATIFISVPDKIESEVILKSNNSIKEVIALSTGRLCELYVTDKENVQKGDLLAKIALNDSSINLLELESDLNILNHLIGENRFSEVSKFKTFSSKNLSLQNSLEAINKSLNELEISISKNGFSAKRKVVENRLQGLRTMNSNLAEQEMLYAKDFKLANDNYKVQESLYKQDAISLLELKNEKSILTSKELAWKQIQSQRIRNDNAQNDVIDQLLELDKSLVIQKNKIKHDVERATAAVSDLKAQNYIYDPISGIASFNKPISKDEFINSGDALFNIIPSNIDIVGVMQVPQNSLGKLATGKKVKIKLNGYNFMQYGIIEGEVSSISETTLDDNFLVKVNFPEKLTTNQDKQIDFKNGLKGVGTIILKETKLFYKLIAVGDTRGT